MEYESFADRHDREFDPSSICFKDDETATQCITKASDISDVFPTMAPKHVYGLALEYALCKENQEHENFVDFVRARYEE